MDTVLKTVYAVMSAMSRDGMLVKGSTEWRNLEAAVLAQQTSKNTKDKNCPHFYKDKFPIGDSDTNFETVHCCRTAGKL